LKKLFFYIASTVLLYGLFREISPVKALIICLGLGISYLVYRIPVRHIIAMKYPFICLVLALTIFFIFFPGKNIPYPFNSLVIFVSLYGLTFYLITIEEKNKNAFKEITALSILFLSSAFNLFMTGNLLFILPISIAILFFLFIIGKNRLIPFIAGYTLAIMTALLLFQKGINITGNGVKINDLEKHILLATSFLFLIISFTGFAKNNNFIKLAAFFGFIYITTDIYLVLGFKLSSGLLYQPLTALLLLTPFIGMMLKTETEHTK